MDEIFNEWNLYAEKKVLKPRAMNIDAILKNSSLKIIALTGIRRAGKSSLLILMWQKLKREKAAVSYLSLEDTRLKGEKELLEKILKWFGDKGYLFLDEIVSASDWEGWLARNHELLKGNLHLIVSSSRHGLAVPKKLLRGRMLSYEVYPLSFREFLHFTGATIEETTAGRGRIEKLLHEYLTLGGYPEVALTSGQEDKLNLLQSYFREIVGLDVAEIAKEELSTVELFGKYILENVYFSASKCLNFFKSVGYKTSKQTLLKLEKAAQEGCLFFFLPIFSTTITDRSQYPRKSYVGDTGFLYAVTGRIDWGKLYENAVFLELKRRLPSTWEINYWKNKDGAEVDFILREGLQTREAIQVVFSLEKEETKKREINGAIACAKENGLAQVLVITKDYEGEETIGKIRLNYLPLWRWLMKGEVT